MIFGTKEQAKAWDVERGLVKPVVPVQTAGFAALGIGRYLEA